eukprot:Nitzschia sp. Nitz4//scaffold25_size161228//124480//125370//NITZ4_002450-RA/size161228-processed-gene-0.88-mRNA-1//-1//CDS//3329544646//5475//frame0
MAPADEKPITIGDFFNPSKPWVLGRKRVAFVGSFLDFIPDHYRFGPWRIEPCVMLGAIVYLVVMGASWMLSNPPNEKGWMSLFEIDAAQYEPYTFDWYCSTAVFVWMVGICYDVAFVSPLGPVAWISFTLWSWTTLTIRHGLVAASPFIPMLRVPAEVLRFPALLSASITTCIWNLVLFPAISFYYITDAEKRKSFIKYFTNFRLTQLHVFNFIFAVANCVYLQPIRPMHLGDFAAAVVMLYLCILDRLGIHLYPIFSPRSPFAAPALVLMMCCVIGGYLFWKQYLPPLE